MNKLTLSIDWEDFGQLYGMYHFSEITEPVNNAIDRQTGILLELLDKYNVKATFFILGMLAKSRPDLVRKIKSSGHEIALHGMNHKTMFGLNKEEAARDISDSYKLVCDISGDKILGYRAPFFSIIESNLYLLDLLADIGIEYDSSIFPKKMSRYGISNFSEDDCLYTLPGGKKIVELPLTLGTYFNKKWPVAGGGYIRLMPAKLVKKVFSDLKDSGKGGMVYMHPYEFDSSPITVAANYPPGAKYSALKVHALNLRWNIFRSSVLGKIENLLQEHEFVTCKQKAAYVKENGIGSKLLGRP